MTYCGLIRRLVLRRPAGCRAKVGRCVSPFLVSAIPFFLSLWFDGWFSARTVFFFFLICPQLAFLFPLTHLHHLQCCTVLCSASTLETSIWSQCLLDTQFKHGAKGLDASLCCINTSVVMMQYILYRWKDFFMSLCSRCHSGEEQSDDKQPLGAAEAQIKNEWQSLKKMVCHGNPLGGNLPPFFFIFFYQ